jgi:hypothetical protein
MHDEPAQSIYTINTIDYPQVPNYNLASISQSIFDRFYSQYISRLRAVGYRFPPRPRYQEQFGEPIGSSFIISESDGLTLNPANDHSWLVFHSRGGQELTVLIARTVVLDGKYVILVGENPRGVYIRLDREDVLNGVTVPAIHADALVGERVLRV